MEVVEALKTFFRDLYPFIVQFLLAIIGGGLISAYVTELWTKRRESHGVLLDHLANLIRSYHVYVRLLNSEPSDRNSSELDDAHATFYAEARLLGLSKTLYEESESLIEIANSLFQVRKLSELSKAEVEAELSPIYASFAKVLDNIQTKLNLDRFF